MLLSPYLAASTLLIASTLAAPHSSGSKRSDDCGCVTEDDAWDVAWVFQDLIQRYSADLATSALTEDFQDWSSSVSTLINQGAALPQNLTAPTFSSRAEFMKGQGGQPQIPFDILNVFWGCDHVAVRWQTTRPALGQPTEAASLPVVGNAILAVEPAEEGNAHRFRINTLFSEFNSGAWLVDLGTFKPIGPVPPVDKSIHA